ncbi:MAG TPA: MFS transporter [bacterium]|nr:MFS transporter [bacterium]
MPPGRMVLPRPGGVVPVAAATRFLQWGILGVIIPVSNLLRMSKGLGLAELGFSAAITASIVVALELPTGVLADRLGRKLTYLASLVFQAASCLALLFSSGFLAVSLGFGLYGISRALSSGSLEALLIDRYIDSHGDGTLHRLMSATNAADTAGLALGSIAGGFIPGLWVSIAPASNRYHGNLLVMLLLILVLAILVLVSVSEERSAGQDRAGLGAFMKDSMTFITKSPALLAFLAAGIAWGFAFSAIETYWQPRIAGIAGAGGSDRLNGFLSAGYFLAALVGSLATLPLLEKTRIRPGMALLALRLMTAAFVIALAVQMDAIGFAVLYVAMFFWNGMASPLETTVLNRALPSDKRASMLSMVSMAMQLGGLIGAVVFGLVVGAAGIPFAWFVAAAALGASAFLLPIAASGRSYGRGDAADS